MIGGFFVVVLFWILAITEGIKGVFLEQGRMKIFKWPALHWSVD